jgi:hypothetical protein
MKAEESSEENVEPKLLQRIGGSFKLGMSFRARQERIGSFLAFSSIVHDPTRRTHTTWRPKVIMMRQSSP